MERKQAQFLYLTKETVGRHRIRLERRAGMITIIKLDIQALNAEIYSRVKPPSYLIMNEETFNAIKHELLVTMPEECANKFMKREFRRYAGVPVVICDGLPYGFIDIKD
nr:MAG TPA: capsid protein [Caudoviricetes sp.]